MLSALCGYGNVAGLLFSKGVLNAPPPPSGETSDYVLPQDVNSITGIKEEEREPQPEMTEEEKEQEMEKLFVLFDRLEKSGALPSEQNPMRKIIQKQMSGS